MKTLALLAALLISSTVHAAGALYEARGGVVRADGSVEVIVQTWTDSVRSCVITLDRVTIKKSKLKGVVMVMKDLLTNKSVFLSPRGVAKDGMWPCLVYTVEANGQLKELNGFLVTEKLAEASHE
jgi:hypothetical protein